MEVFSEEWAATCRDRLNDRSRMKSVASWSSPVALVMRPDSRLGVERERVIYLELRDGVCVVARAANASDRAHADFVLAADAAQWKRMLSGALDPIPAVMLGKLKLERGSLTALLPHAAAARELIAAARDAGGDFPDAAGRANEA